MEKFKNSCGNRRGCSVRIILPHDSGVNNVRSRMLPIRNDIQKVLSINKPPLDLLEVKKAA